MQMVENEYMIDNGDRPNSDNGDKPNSGSSEKELKIEEVELKPRYCVDDRVGIDMKIG